MKITDVAQLEDQIGRFMRPSDRALVLDWISKQPATPIWDDGMRSSRTCYLQAAVELCKAGIAASDLTAYALRQVVLELYKGDPTRVSLENVCHAYAAVFNATMAGPATKMCVEAVRDAYRR